MDIDYMDGYRIFTFDKTRFPDPKATNDYLHGKAFHSVWIIDPGVKTDPNYSVYQSGSERHLWVRTKDGGDYHGNVCPATACSQISPCPRRAGGGAISTRITSPRGSTASGTT